MQFSALNIWKYRLPLEIPIPSGKTPLHTREGLLIEMKAEDAVGWGEMAPLPGFHPWTLAKIVKEIQWVAAILQKRQFPDSMEPPASFYHEVEDTIAPITALGFHTAYLHLQSIRLNRPLWKFFCSKERKGIAVQALMDSPPETWGTLSQKLIRQGFHTLKIKIGRFSPEAENAALQQLHTQLPESVQLRLDAQGRFPLMEAVQYGKELKTLRDRIAYVEDPVQNLDDFALFAEKTGLAVALDIREPIHADINFLKSHGIQYAILKPEFFSTWDRYFQIGKEMIANHIIPVMSNAFTSGLTRAWQVIVGSCWPISTAHGLGTARYFSEDLVENSSFKNKNFIFLPEAVHSINHITKTRLELLQEIIL